MVESSIKYRMLEAFRFRMFFFLAIASIMFVLLIIQLINIQLIQGEEYQQKSRMNMENIIPLPASRGEMYDRHYTLNQKNKVLVSNRPSFDITTIPVRFQNEDVKNTTIRRLSKLLNVSYEDISENFESSNPWERVIIKEDVPFGKIVMIASHKNLFPNINWEDQAVRVYNYDNMFAHIAGYVGNISKNEYQELKDTGYKYYHKIGKNGLEKEYDLILRGEDGFIRRIVDVRNRMEGEEIGSQPIAGNNIVLSIDFEVQKCVYEAMSNLKGAVVVLKPSTGEILALVSKPDFNPNLLVSGLNVSRIKELNNDRNRPFLNRTIQSRYPPASVFKLITSIAALEEEKWNANWTYTCRGKYTLKGYVDRDFYCMKYHGNLDMHQAIAKSCSSYFYQLGYKIGPTLIMKYARLMGLSEKTSIDIPGEISGFIPSKKWKRRVFGEQWFDGDTVNLSIGQGFASVTPIAIANFISGIINNGIIYKPRLVKEIRSNDNTKVIKKIEPEKTREIPLSTKTINALKHGMALAVKTGTARRLSYFKLPIAGKTGTAQTRSLRKDDRYQHAWFAGYAPYNGDVEQSVVVVVLVEYGIAGATSAVPIAERIFWKMIKLGYF